MYYTRRLWPADVPSEPHRVQDPGVMAFQWLVKVLDLLVVEFFNSTRQTLMPIASCRQTEGYFVLLIELLGVAG